MMEEQIQDHTRGYTQLFRGVFIHEGKEYTVNGRYGSTQQLIGREVVPAGVEAKTILIPQHKWFEQHQSYSGTTVTMGT